MSESIDRSDPPIVATVKPKTAPVSKPRRLPPFAVVVENDPDHTFAYVTDALQRVFGYGWFKSTRLTVQIHFRGRAAVWTGPLETCEFKRERLQSLGPDLYAPRPVTFPLGVRLEPMAG